MLKLAGVLVILIGLAAVWRWSPLAQWVTIENMAAWAGEIRSHPMSFPIIMVVYVAAGFLMVPITLLVGATAMVYDPVWAVLCAFSGCLLSALATFLTGGGLGKQMVRKLAGKKLNHISQQMAKNGILNVALIRNIPVAPFTIINLIAGVSHIRLKDYLLGTALGMMPGILAITIFADRLLQTIMHPDWINVVIAVAVAAALVAGNIWVTKWLSRIQEKKEKQ